MGGITGKQLPVAQENHRAIVIKRLFPSARFVQAAVNGYRATTLRWGLTCLYYP
jgi:hypothetical protein